MVGCKLRISQVSAGVDLLTKYRTGELKRLLEELLIGHCLKDVAHVEELSLVINLMEEEVSKALEILTGNSFRQKDKIFPTTVGLST